MSTNPQIKKKVNTNKYGEWLSLGASFITIVSGVGSVITLYYLYNQYKSSIKPDIIIDDAKVTMIAERYNTSGYVHFLYENDSIDKKKLLYNGYTCGSTYIISPDAESNSFVFNLTNVGLGVTKNISLFWSFDTLKVINVFNDNKPILYLDSIKFENSNFIFFEKDGKNIYSEFSHRIDKQTNYVLPINNSNETVNCKLPYLYLKLYSCYEILSNFFQLKSDLRKEIKGEFPTLQLKVTYNDIDNSRYSKNYVINI